MKRITNLIFFALLAITSYSQVANPTYWERKQYGSNWIFDYDTVRVNRLMVDQKLCIDSLGTIVYYNNALPAAKMLMVGNGTRFTTLAGGTALQYLRVNAAGTALEYATLDAGDLGGFTDTYILVGQPDGTAGGDNSFMWDGTIMTCLGTGYFDDGVNIGGTSGSQTFFDDQGRISDYNGADVAAGDLLYGTNGGGVYAVLPLGTADQILRVNGGGTNLEWGSLTSGIISDFNEAAMDAVLPAFYNVIFDDDDATDFITLKDRDAGDITLSGGFGAVWTVDNLAITDAKINDVALSKVTGLGTNIATFLATPSSANERAALTDENGGGADLFDGATSPTFAGTTAMASASLTGTIEFEGATPDASETILTVTDPTADRAITLPNTTGTVALTSQLGYTLQGNSAQFNPADGTTYYVGGAPQASNSTPATNRIYIPFSGTITTCYVMYQQTAGDATTSTVSIRYDNTTDTQISNVVTNDAAFTTFSNTGLAIAVTAGHYIELKWVAPTWPTTNPTACKVWFVVGIVPN